MSEVQIDKNFDRQLLVEGYDDEVFFDQLAKYLGSRESFGIVRCGGWTSIGDQLLNILSDTEYFRNVKHIGIVRDADRNPDAFSSVQSALNYANREVSKQKTDTEELKPILQYLVPTKHLVMTTESPYISVLILPGADTQGTLENYVIKALKCDRLWACVRDYFNCLPTVGLHIDEGRRAKSEIGVFISGKVVDPKEATPRDSRRKLLSDIYRLKWWDDNNLWADDNFSDATRFLRQLVEDIPFDAET